MPEGPFGFTRLTNIGPLVERTSTDVPPPSFKTKTFGWDSTDFAFSNVNEPLELGDLTRPGGRGVERGSSFSLDGVFNRRKGYAVDNSMYFVTFIYPLDTDLDIPFFYLNPFGKTSGRIGREEVMYDSPTFFTETEVVVKEGFNTDLAEGVVINITAEDIRRMAENRKEDVRDNPDADKFGWKEHRLDKIEEDAEWAINDVKNIRSEFTVLDEVPQTKFADIAMEVGGDITDFTYRDEWSKVEKRLQPIHETVAETYDIDYDRVLDDIQEKMEDI